MAEPTEVYRQADLSGFQLKTSLDALVEKSGGYGLKSGLQLPEIPGVSAEALPQILSDAIQAAERNGGPPSSHLPQTFNKESFEILAETNPELAAFLGQPIGQTNGYETTGMESNGIEVNGVNGSAENITPVDGALDVVADQASGINADANGQTFTPLEIVPGIGPISAEELTGINLPDADEAGVFKVHTTQEHAFDAVAIGSEHAGRKFQFLSDQGENGSTLPGDRDGDDKDPEQRLRRQMSQMMLIDQISRIDAQITEIDYRLAEIQNRVDEIDTRVDEIDNRIGEIENREAEIQAENEQIQAGIPAKEEALQAQEAVVQEIQQEVAEGRAEAEASQELFDSYEQAVGLGALRQDEATGDQYYEHNGRTVRVHDGELSYVDEDPTIPAEPLDTEEVLFCGQVDSTPQGQKVMATHEEKLAHLAKREEDLAREQAKQQAMKQDLQQDQDTLNTNNKELETLANEKATLIAERDVILAEKAALEAEGKELTEQRQALLDEKQDLIATINSEANSLGITQDELKESINSQTVDISEQANTINSIESEIAALKIQLAEAEQEAAELEIEKAEIDANVEESTQTATATSEARVEEQSGLRIVNVVQRDEEGNQVLDENGEPVVIGQAVVNYERFGTKTVFQDINDPTKTYEADQIQDGQAPGIFDKLSDGVSNITGGGDADTYTTASQADQEAQAQLERDATEQARVAAEQARIAAEEAQLREQMAAAEAAKQEEMAALEGSTPDDPAYNTTRTPKNPDNPRVQEFDRIAQGDDITPDDPTIDPNADPNATVTDPNATGPQQFAAAP